MIRGFETSNISLNPISLSYIVSDLIYSMI